MPTALSLRSNFAWTFAGNAAYAAGQWAILSLLAKLGSAEMLGQYALALAVTAPVVMLAHLNLRAVLATDVAGKHPFGDYLMVRAGSTLLGLAAIAAVALWSGSATLVMVVLAVGIAQSAENVSDIFYGALQRRERMDRIARSMMARALVSVAALGVALWTTHSIVAAVAALAGARLATLLLYDVRSGEALNFTGIRNQLSIVRTALPLGIVLMLVTLNTNLPRYAIERALGTPALGAFAAVASFLTAGNTVVNALGQSATPRLARHFLEGERGPFHLLVLRLVAMAIVLGAAGVAVSAAAGGMVLRLVYRAEFSEYADVLTVVMIVSIPIYVASMLGYVITSVRAFDAQLPLFCVVAASCAAASALLIPRYGLMGAPAALGLAACVQSVGEAVILLRAFRRREAAT